MSELGQKLRSVRESKGLSLQEVGLALKISPRIIAAIETGEKSGQPAKTFLRGFVKSYAQYLKMDYLPLLDMFDSEYSMEPLANKSLRIEPENFEDPASKITAPKAVLSTPDTPAKSAAPTQFPSFPWGKSVLIAVLFVMIVILAKVVHKYQKERSLPDEVIVGTPVEATSTPEPIPVLDPSASPSTSEGSVASDSGTLAAAAATATPSPTATTTPSPSPTPEPTPKPTPSPSPSPSPTPSPAATPQISTGERFEVLIEAGKNVALTLDLGGGKVSSFEMNKGDVQVIRSRSPISLEASDGSALTVFLNGRAKPKGSSQPLKMRIPQ